jgi:hypothetical protein
MRFVLSHPFRKGKNAERMGTRQIDSPSPVPNCEGPGAPVYPHALARSTAFCQRARRSARSATSIFGSK